ncbi:unnamed protein product, partial [Rotaria sp. Silwood2]
MNRYENTIADQFYGYTHNDEIDHQRPVSM